MQHVSSCQCAFCLQNIHSHSSKTRALRPFGLQMASRRMNSTKDLSAQVAFPAGNSGPLQATDPCARKTAVSACLPVECCLWDGSAALSNRLETILFFPQQQSFAMGSLARSGAIRCSFNTRFRTRFRKFPVQVLGEVPEGSGEDTCWGSEGFCAVPEGSGADTLWGSRGFRCRYLVRFRKFPVQVLGEVPEGCGDTWLGSRGFCCR